MILLGIWGALVPFFGPYFHYAFGSDQTWHYTSERLWLCIIPGAVAVIGGLMLLRSAHRTSGLFGGWLALAAGAWFAIGPADQPAVASRRQPDRRADGRPHASGHRVAGLLLRSGRR